jgi:nucleoside-diphosphate-sugar epimerase
MRVLVTGCDGYIGQVLVPLLQSAGHHVTGLDSGLFADCVFPGQPRPIAPILWCDVRDVTPAMLAGFDAVIHLAGMSNDPYGDLNPAMTDAVNHQASVRLAEAAKAAGVSRYVFASSCSNYGSSDDGFLDEEAPFNPVTPYAVSKVLSEQNIGPLADARFSPIFLRAGTAYGISAKLRADLVVNNLTGYAFTTGHVMMRSDGIPWRPLVHVEDIARAYLAVIEAPREQVHNQAFNVGATEENYRVRQVAELVAEIVPGATVSFAAGAGPDLRNYRVNCDKIRRLVPTYQPKWSLRQGIEQLYGAYREAAITEADFFGPRWMRVEHVKRLIAAGRVDDSLRYAREAA